MSHCDAAQNTCSRIQGGSTKVFRLTFYSPARYSIVCKATKEAAQSGEIILFKMDIRLDNLAEAIEESQGGKVFYFDCSNVSKIPNSAFSTNLYEVHLSLIPGSYHDADLDSILVEAPTDDLYELVNGQYVPAAVEYPYLGFANRKFFLHGHAVSTTENDHAVTIRHKQNECMDRFRYTVYDVQIRFFYYASEDRDERVYYNLASLPNPPMVPVLYDYGRTSNLLDEWLDFGLELAGIANLGVSDVSWEFPSFFVNIWCQVQLKRNYRGTWPFLGISSPTILTYSPHVPDGINGQIVSIEISLEGDPEKTWLFGAVAHYHEWGHQFVCIRFIRKGLGSWILSEIDGKKAGASLSVFQSNAFHALKKALEKPLGENFYRSPPLAPMPSTISRDTAISGGGDYGTILFFKKDDDALRPGWTLISGNLKCPIEYSYYPPTSDRSPSPQKEEKLDIPDESFLFSGKEEFEKEEFP